MIATKEFCIRNTFSLHSRALAWPEGPFAMVFPVMQVDFFSAQKTCLRTQSSTRRCRIQTSFGRYTAGNFWKSEYSQNRTKLFLLESIVGFFYWPSNSYRGCNHREGEVGFKQVWVIRNQQQPFDIWIARWCAHFGWYCRNGKGLPLPVVIGDVFVVDRDYSFAMMPLLVFVGIGIIYYLFAIPSRRWQATWFTFGSDCNFVWKKGCPSLLSKIKNCFNM